MLTVGDYSLRLVPTQGAFPPFEQTITISPKVLTVVDRTFGQQGLGSGSIINLTPLSDPKDAQISVVSFSGRKPKFFWTIILEGAITASFEEYYRFRPRIKTVQGWL